MADAAPQPDGSRAPDSRHLAKVVLVPSGTLPTQTTVAMSQSPTLKVLTGKTMTVMGNGPVARNALPAITTADTPPGTATVSITNTHHHRLLLLRDKPLPPADSDTVTA